MTKHNKKLYIRIFILIVFFIIFVFFIYLKEKKVVVENIIQKLVIPSPLIKSATKTQTSNLEKNPVPEKENLEIKNTEDIILLLGKEIVNLSFTPNMFFYDALIDWKSQGKIEFAGKNYPGLGFFVTDIGSLHAGNGKYLLYYVNGKEATVGVSSYRLKNGDIIEWKLK